MAEKSQTTLNQDFIVDAQKHKKLLEYAQKVFENPQLLADADIYSLSPDNPALASKVLLSAYTRALKEEARKLDTPDKSSILEELHQKYEQLVNEFREKNRSLLDSLTSTKQGGKQLWQWKNLKEALTNCLMTQSPLLTIFGKTTTKLQNQTNKVYFYQEIFPRTHFIRLVEMTQDVIPSRRQWT